MPSGSCYDDAYSDGRREKAKLILARGLDARSNGFMRAYYSAMKK